MTPIYHANVIEFQHIALGRAQRGGGTENKKNKANHHPSKTCASGGARFLSPKEGQGSVRVAQTSRKIVHKITPKSIKKRYHRQRLFTNLFQERSGTDFKIDTRH